MTEALGSMSSNSHSNNDLDMSSGHRRTLPGSILSKLNFLRTNGDGNQGTSKEKELAMTTPCSSESVVTIERAFSKKPPRSIAVAVQQKNRRRKGSLRKTALLGRGAQREKKEMKSSSTTGELSSSKRVVAAADENNNSLNSSTPPLPSTLSVEQRPFTAHLGRSISDNGSRLKEYTNYNSPLLSPITTILPMGKPDQHVTLPTTDVSSPTLSYTSTTTDEDEIISMQNHHGFHSSSRASSAGSESGSYFPPDAVSLVHHRSVKQAKSSPLSIAGLTQNHSSPALECGWDYSETEWWGWVLLFVTWIVFVVGMGSCLSVWSWAWDVGETPYAPPELEDDPTLPIVGYYPALIILTSVMVWVWVTVAWVGMKYFRHTKISGD